MAYDSLRQVFRDSEVIAEVKRQAEDLDDNDNEIADYDIEIGVYDINGEVERYVPQAVYTFESIIGESIEESDASIRDYIKRKGLVQAEMEENGRSVDITVSNTPVEDDQVLDEEGRSFYVRLSNDEKEIYGYFNSPFFEGKGQVKVFDSEGNLSGNSRVSDDTVSIFAVEDLWAENTDFRTRDIGEVLGDD